MGIIEMEKIFYIYSEINNNNQEEYNKHGHAKYGEKIKCQLI